MKERNNKKAIEYNNRSRMRQNHPSNTAILGKTILWVVRLLLLVPACTSSRASESNGARLGSSSKARCLGDFSVLAPGSEECVAARRLRPRRREDTNPRVVFGKISGIEPGEEISITVLNGTESASWSRPSFDDVAFDAPGALQPDGSFAIYLGTTPLTLVRVDPSKHRPVEIMSAADELCVGIRLRSQ